MLKHFLRINDTSDKHASRRPGLRRRRPRFAQAEVRQVRGSKAFASPCRERLAIDAASLVRINPNKKVTLATLLGRVSTDYAFSVCRSKHPLRQLQFLTRRLLQGVSK